MRSREPSAFFSNEPGESYALNASRRDPRKVARAAATGVEVRFLTPNDASRR